MWRTKGPSPLKKLHNNMSSRGLYTLSYTQSATYAGSIPDAVVLSITRKKEVKRVNSLPFTEKYSHISHTLKNKTKTKTKKEHRWGGYG